MKVLCQNAWCHIFAGDTLYLYLFVFKCGVFPCLSVLVLDGFPLRTGAVGSFLVLCLVFLTFLVHMHCGSCTGGKCHFSCAVNVVIVSIFV